MRLFETLLFFPLFAWLIGSFFSNKPKWFDGGLTAVTLILFLLHFFLEGTRWQLNPVYILLSLFMIIAGLNWLTPLPSLPKLLPIIGSIIGLLISGLALFFAIALPVPQSLPVRGEYLIGTSNHVSIDETRAEIYTDNPTDRRKLVWQIWYPAADRGAGERAPYMAGVEHVAPATAVGQGLPSFTLNHLARSQTDSWLNAPVLEDDGPYPLIMFVQGLGGFRGQNTSLIQELVSQGYVVTSIDHPYATRAAVFPDGTVIPYGDDALLFSNEGTPPRNGQTLVDVWAGDVQFILDQLQAGQPFPTDFIDFSRVAIVGHSTGGGTAITVCGRDARCGAYVALDSWVEPVPDETIFTNTPPQPGLFINTPEWLNPENKPRGEAFFARLKSASYRLTIQDTKHMDYTDVPLHSPIATTLGFSGALDGVYTVEVVNQYTLAFLDSVFKATPTDLFTDVPYPEVTVKTP